LAQGLGPSTTQSEYSSRALGSAHLLGGPPIGLVYQTVTLVHSSGTVKALVSEGSRSELTTFYEASGLTPLCSSVTGPMNSINSTSMNAWTDGATLEQVANLLSSVRMELILFVVAMLAYRTLFGNAVKKNGDKGARHKLGKLSEEDSTETLCSRAPNLTAQERAQLDATLEASFAAGDHRMVLKCWTALKKCDALPSSSLIHVVESMQRFKKDSSYIVRELRAFFKKFGNEVDMDCVNGLLESMAKRLDTDLMEKVVEILPSAGLKQDQKTYEIFLNTHFTMRNFDAVSNMVVAIKAEKVPLTTRSMIVVIKTALKMNKLHEALEVFGELKSMWVNQANPGAASASTAPRHILMQLIELTCKEQQLGEFLPQLEDVPLPEEAVNTMLSACIKQKDLGLAQKVEKLARTQGLPFSDTTYSLLIKGLSGDAKQVADLFDEVEKKGGECTTDFALAVLAFCNQTKNVKMAQRLYELMKPKQPSVLAAFIRFYTEAEQFDEACDIYEKDLLQLLEKDGDGTDRQRSLLLDARIERGLMNAALRCGRTKLAQQLLNASPSDVSRHISMIRNCASEGNLKGAMSVFNSLKQSGMELNSIVYNTVLDACVECRDLSAAEEWMSEMKKVGMSDVVSFNTLIKAHLMYNNFKKAWHLIEVMKQEGLQPNRVTFNELINGLITQGGASKQQVWEVLDEMKTLEVKPNQVTCSILLKSLNSHSSQTDILKTMDLINAMEEPMDEVLLSSVVEACVRIGKPDLLAEKLKQLQGSNNIAVNGAHTFGSLIKAYGHANDVDGVWRCWKEMRSRHIRPTSITLGCMVEAIVSNGDPEGAYELIHQLQDDEQCHNALNSVIYCSVLKGFTREKKLERAWAVYEEMTNRKVELSIVTYNTLIDACARCGRMDQVPAIRDDMKKYGIHPNVITYSTILKGHCQIGELQKAFAMLEQMKKEARLKPDEIMYNSLLDGCAQNNMVEEGLHLLEVMQKEGVNPSNFTLSILVKMMSRAHKVDAAFSLVMDLSKQYNFRPNVHVYTNLIQACVSNRSLHRGMGVLETMVKERIQPDNRTYNILIRASLSSGLLDQAMGLLRAALCLPGAPAALAQRVAECPTLDYGLVNETLVGLVDRGCPRDAVVGLLCDIKQHKPKVRIEASTQRAIMVSGSSSPDQASTQREPQGYRQRGQGQRAPQRDSRYGRQDRNDGPRRSYQNQ